MSDLDTYRAEINNIDEQIMKLIAKRQAQIIKIAGLKAKAGMAAHQPDRHQAVISDRQNQAIEHGLNPDMVASIWQLLMAEAIRIQNAIFSTKSTK